MVRISNAVQDEFIRGTTYDFTDASHQFGDERPCQIGDQHTDQATAPVGQARGGDAGNKLLLFYDTQHLLACRRVHIRFVVQHTRNRRRRYTGQFSDVANSSFPWHGFPPNTRSMKYPGCAYWRSDGCWRFPCRTHVAYLSNKDAVNVTVNVYGIVYNKYTDGIGPCQVQNEGISGLSKSRVVSENMATARVAMWPDTV